jgi:hypothetical protein
MSEQHQPPAMPASGAAAAAHADEHSAQQQQQEQHQQPQEQPGAEPGDDGQGPSLTDDEGLSPEALRRARSRSRSHSTDGGGLGRALLALDGEDKARLDDGDSGRRDDDDDDSGGELGGGGGDGYGYDVDENLGGGADSTGPPLPAGADAGTPGGSDAGALAAGALALARGGALAEEDEDDILIMHMGDDGSDGHSGVDDGNVAGAPLPVPRERRACNAPQDAPNEGGARTPSSGGSSPAASAAPDQQPLALAPVMQPMSKSAHRLLVAVRALFLAQDGVEAAGAAASAGEQQQRPVSVIAFRARLLVRAPCAVVRCAHAPRAQRAPHLDRPDKLRPPPRSPPRDANLGSLSASFQSRLAEAEALGDSSGGKGIVSRQMAAHALTDLLLLASHDCLELEQDQPYAEIQIRAGPRWDSDTYASSVSGDDDGSHFRQESAPDSVAG